jgi:RimJ/RimL family protein N-acetyltransferase
MAQGTSVRLRAVEEADLEPYIRYLSRPEDWAHEDIYAPVPRAIAAGWLAELGRPFAETRRLGLAIVASAGDDRARGLVTLGPVEPIFRVAEVGIAIWDPADRRKGYGRAALALALEIAFDRLNLRRLECEINASNTASAGLFEAAGFRREGVLRERVLCAGKAEDVLVYGLLDHEWRRGR